MSDWKRRELLVLVVKKDTNGKYEVDKYLDAHNDWRPERSNAYEYYSMGCFTHASEFGGRVFIRLPNGREIEVYEHEFESLWKGQAQ